MGNEILAKYSFLPWFRQGLGTLINEKDLLGAPGAGIPAISRATLDVNLQVEGDGEGRGEPVNRPVHLFGAGDITGIESRAIIKTEPKKGLQNFEYNFLPYIEFYEEDFPWRYTPLAPDGNKLRPWLALVVFKENEFEREPFNGVLPSFSLKAGPQSDLFPPANQTWAWAHVHVNGNLKTKPEDTDEVGLNRLESIIAKYPNLACSRIICPRKLEPNTKYFAFLIPAFEKGRLAGLGASREIIDQTDIQLASWGHKHAHFEGRWCIYYEWSFKTGGVGEDFETMVKKIKHRDLDARVGKEWVDTQSPGYKLSFDGGEEPNKGALLMEGALRLPDSAEPNLLQLANSAHPEIVSFVKDLVSLVNLNEDLKEASPLPADHKYATNPLFEEDEASIYDDPIITPPLYGQWHILQNKVDATTAGKQKWINQLNLDPRNRIAAGLGAEVIRRNQDGYMDRAWAQFGELFEVNKYLKRTQFIIQVNSRVVQKHLQPLSTDRLLSATVGMHHVIKSDSNKSLKGLIKERNIPKSVMTMAFNKIARPNGAMMKRAGVTPKDLVQVLIRKIGISNMPFVQMNEAGGSIGSGGIYQPTKHPLDGLIDSALYFLERPTDDTWGWKTGLLSKIGISDVAKYQEALSPFINYFENKNWEKEPVKAALDLNGLRDNFIKQVNPAESYVRRINTILSTGNGKSPEEDIGEIEPIVKAPVFDDPMYEEVVKISAERFIPNLELIAPDTIAEMQVNRAYIESYLVGLNYEMARELLWREFPTDQRGTYFRKFWDFRNDFKTPEQADITPIHTWDSAGLGSHKSAAYESSPLVLVIKSELFNRYPNTIIYMEKAIQAPGEEGTKIPRKLSGSKKEFPLFEARVDPDIVFLGFNISKNEAIGNPGYFLVIEERPGEIHFGMDSPDQADNTILNTWDDLNWTHLKDVANNIDLDRDYPGQPNNVQDKDPHWGTDAADMSWILFQKPVQIAIHATALLKTTES